jgi:hypothetical protein
MLLTVAAGRLAGRWPREVGDHGKDAPMAVLAGGQVEFRQHAAHVALNGALGEG